MNALGALGLGDTVDRGDDADEMGDALPAVSLGTGVTVATDEDAVVPATPAPTVAVRHFACVFFNFCTCLSSSSCGS